MAAFIIAKGTKMVCKKLFLLINKSLCDFDYITFLQKLEFFSPSLHVNVFCLILMQSNIKNI